MSNGQTLIYVNFVSVDTSAKQYQIACLPNEKAMEMKKQILNAYWPHYEFLGDFHTHPYNDLYEVENCEDDSKGWHLSKQDIIRIEDKEFSPFWVEHDYALTLIAAIVKMSRKGKAHYEKSYDEINMLRFDIGNFRIWLSAHIVCSDDHGNLRYLLKDEMQQNVLLDCPEVHGIDGEFERFRSF